MHVCVHVCVCACVCVCMCVCACKCMCMSLCAISLYDVILFPPPPPAPDGFDAVPTSLCLGTCQLTVIASSST